MLSTGATLLPTSSSDRPNYTVSTSSKQQPVNKPSTNERIIPIEAVAPPYRY